MLDTIGVIALGIELDTLSSTYPVGFRELYHTILNPSPMGQLVWVINSFIPIRSWLPLKANRQFVQANTDLRKMLRDIIQQRVRDLGDGTLKKEMGESRDLLTYMLEEAEIEREKTGEQVWTEEDITGHVSNAID
jgi:cytochrome P450